MGDHWQSDVVRLTREDVHRLLESFGGPGAEGVVLNPDVLISAESVNTIAEGDYQLVVGELHADRDLLSHSATTVFLDPSQAEAVRRFATDGYRAAAEADEVVAEVVRTHARKTNVQLPLEFPHVEMQNRAVVSRDRVVPAAELEVKLDAERLRLFSARLGAYVKLMVARVPIGSDERTSMLRPFSFPRRDFVLPLPSGIRYCPRIEVGRTVLQRRLWRETFNEWSSVHEDDGWSLSLYRSMHRMAHERGIPRQVFAKVDGERKATFVDFDSYLLVHAFYNIWRKRQGAVTLVEVLPALQNWWLRDERGTYSCELRLGYFRRSASRG